MNEATPRATYLATNPEAKKLHNCQVKEFRRKYCDFIDGGVELKGLFKSFIKKADQAREIGIVLIEFCESLPGAKLTRDFYEQEKEFFTDGQGRPVSFDMLQWFMRIARENLDPIADIATALKYRQPMLLATGDNELVLQSERPQQRHVPPPDNLATFKEMLNPSEWIDAWKQLQSNENYCPDGHFRDTLREILNEQLAPTFPVWHEIEANVKGWPEEKRNRVMEAIES